MKIVEALKRLRVIEKKFEKNKMEISEYSSMPNVEKPIFETEAKQKKEVESRIQSNLDLSKEYMKLKKDIEYTNLVTKIKLQDQEWSISDLLVLQRKLAKEIINTYNSLNDTNAQRKIDKFYRYNAPHDNKTVVPTRFYDEKDKNEQIRYWSDLYNEISSRLEVVNATTDLVEFEQ